MLNPSDGQKVISLEGKKKKFFIETYGCQMNFSDSEIVTSILTDHGFDRTCEIQRADIILVNTCSIRKHAEERVRNRLQHLGSLKRKKPGLLIGLLGCMAERTEDSLMEVVQFLDVIAGPDSYRDLPRLLTNHMNGIPSINVLLSEKETYADIVPVRLDSNGVTAFISVMRGCENHCAYCVVPAARGIERSREPQSILHEFRDLIKNGYHEVTLLGQNVNSYDWFGDDRQIRFPELLKMAAQVSGNMRIRFATSHPKDLSDDLLSVIAEYPNICKSIHLPVQSGSNAVLERMNRKYTREQYLELIQTTRRIIPGCTISTDMIAGFCGETEEDHQLTLSLMRSVHFDAAFMFQYSERPQTLAAKQYKDDVPEAVKKQRLKEIIDLQQHLSLESNKKDIGQFFEVLVEGPSKRSKSDFTGRTSQNKVVVFPKDDCEKGQYVNVLISKVTAATLMGNICR
jgi:tRNA-2-methylthio-N6-dimethylallyladenosine synthase